MCARISSIEAKADGVYRSVPHVPEPVMLADDCETSGLLYPDLDIFRGGNSGYDQN